MKVTNEIKKTSFPKLMQSTGTERLFLVGDLTGNGYPYISLSNSDSGFFTNFNNLVEYNRKVVLENN